MRPGFNATRRSRNIGTAKQGHGQNNRLRIPSVCGDERTWSQQLGPHRLEERWVLRRRLTFIIEETSGGCIHACTVDDVCHMLGLMPFADWDGLETFVFRQPRRKQAILNPVWGRLSYAADFGRPAQRTVRWGPAVTLEAQQPNGLLRWGAKLPLSDQEELERLRDDGHRVERDGPRWTIALSPESIRATQLYRTLPHEIGHWVDWLEKVERPEAAGGDYDALSDAYFARPADEREAFAHRHADQIRKGLIGSGLLPFPPINPADAPD